MADPFDILLGTQGAVTPGEKAIVGAESGGNPLAVSPKGAIGAWQVMPNTKKNPGFGVVPAKDNSPDELNRVGKDYYNAMLDKYSDPTLAAIAYNWGPGSTDKWISSGADVSKLPAETRDYIGKVTALTAINKRGQTANAAPSNDPFDVILNYKPAGEGAQTPQGTFIQQPGFVGSSKAAQIPGGEGYVPQAPQPEPSGLSQALIGVPTAIGSTLYNSIIASPASTLYGVGKELLSGQFGTPQGSQIAQQEYNRAMQSIGITPGPSGQAILEKAEPILSNLPAVGGHVEIPAAVESAKIQPVVKSVQQRIGGNPKVGISEMPSPTPSLVGVGAAESKNNPFLPFQNEETVRGGYPRLKQAKIGSDVSLPEQNNRSAIAAEILGPDANVREGVKTGNIQTLYNEDIQARNPQPTPVGQLLKQTIANEQQGLSNYANSILNDIGVMPQFETPYAFGQFINSVMHGDQVEPGIKSTIESAKRDTYKAAFDAAGNKPIEFSNLEKMLSDPTIQATLKAKNETNFVSGLNDLANLAKNTGFDRAPPGSVAAAEVLRQHLNDIWTPGNSKFVQLAKQAIDDDVANAGGPGLLQRARALHAAEQSIFENAPGMKKLFGDIDPKTGISQGVDFEKIGKNLNNIGIDDWKHIVNTLKKVANQDNPEFGGHVVNFSDDVRQSAKQAINEIGGELMRDVIQAGGKNKDSWNAGAANARLTALKDKLEYILPPDLLRKTHVLNYGGQIMPSSVSYEGAALQGLRAQKQGLLPKILPSAGGAVGGAVGGYLGIPALGGLAGFKGGEKAAAKITANKQLREAEKMMKKMRENAQSGQNNLSEINK